MSYARKSDPTGSGRPARCTVQLKYPQQLQDCIGIGPGPFFENWRASLKWQRLKPYEKFADMIDRHWDGIAA
jgi:hypothetical protein